MNATGKVSAVNSAADEKLDDEEFFDEALDEARGRACYCWANQRSPEE